MKEIKLKIIPSILLEQYNMTVSTKVLFDSFNQLEDAAVSNPFSISYHT